MIINRTFYAEDDGGLGAAVENSEVTDLAGKLAHVSATYEGDLEEALRGDDFTGIEDVGKLYGAYKASKAQNEADKKALEGSLRIPDSESTYDDIKAFFQKIGMPEKAEDYGLSDFDLDPKEIAAMKRNFMDTAHRSGLTKEQARKMWTHEAAYYSSIRKGMQDTVDKIRESFDSRYDAQLRDEYPDSTKRAERITKDRNLFTEFVGEAGIGEFINATGLDLNPAFIHAMAKYYEARHRDTPAGQMLNHKTEADILREKYPSMFK